METRDIRRTNLLRLAEGHRRILDFCELAGIKPAYFSQLKSGVKSLGDDLARRIEENCRLERGYLDVQHEQEQTPRLNADTIGVAYAIEALPQEMRDRVKSLVWSMAAEMSKPKTAAPDRDGAPTKHRIEQ